jgi:starvation-inducible DNA-binding protein
MSQTQKVAEQLNLLLADASVFQQRLRNFHWNVSGDDFYELHEKFELLYTQWFEHIDAVAERIKMLRLRPISTLTEQLELSSLKESTETPNAKDMVKQVVEDMYVIHERILAAIEEAEGNRDRGTVNLLDSFLDLLEKDRWMLEAWLA